MGRGSKREKKQAMNESMALVTVEAQGAEGTILREEQKAEKGVRITVQAYEGVKAEYDRSTKSYATLGTLGIALTLTDRGLIARVEKIGCNVGIGVDPETGKAILKDFEAPKAYAKLDELSRAAATAPKAATYLSACKYLEARYSITQKDYATLVELARAGKRLMTKAERKQSKAA